MGISEEGFIFDFITFGGSLAPLAYHVLKSGHKTSIIILLVGEPCFILVSSLTNYV